MLRAGALLGLAGLVGPGLGRPLRAQPGATFPAWDERGATRYPKYVAGYRRVMSTEDFLTVHSPETTGTPMLAESPENLDMAMLVKMASNGMPVAIDLSNKENQAAFERGRISFSKRAGQRNHACADCHSEGKGADKFLGGRLLEG
jgi:hypothetical protein